MIDKMLLLELKDISKDMTHCERFSQGDEDLLAEALNMPNMSFLDCIARLLYCAKIMCDRKNNLWEETQRQKKQIQMFQSELEKLRKEVAGQQAIMDTYNQVYLQRAKVKSGKKKIAKKEQVTKSEIEKLQAEGFTESEIEAKLKCSRTTIWRRLKDK